MLNGVRVQEGAEAEVRFSSAAGVQGAAGPQHLGRTYRMPPAVTLEGSVKL